MPITLFLFDAQQILRGVWTDKDVELTYEYIMSAPKLQAENCRFIICDSASGNDTTGQMAYVIGETTFNEVFRFVTRHSDYDGQIADCRQQKYIQKQKRKRNT